MEDDNLAEFLKDREEALLSLDLAKINAYQIKYNNRAFPDTETAWAAVHRARTLVTTFPEDVKEISRQWLRDHGYNKVAP